MSNSILVMLYNKINRPISSFGVEKSASAGITSAKERRQILNPTDTMQSFARTARLSFFIAMVCLRFVDFNLSAQDFPSPRTEGPNDNSSNVPSYCLKKGKAAEAARDFAGAYLWYARGAGQEQANSPPDLSYPEPEGSAYFLCNLNFVRVCLKLAQQGIVIGPKPRTEWISGLAETAITTIRDTIPPGKTYCGYTSKQIGTFADNAENILAQSRTDYNNNQAQHYANIQNALNGLNAAASVLNAAVSASSHGNGGGLASEATPSATSASAAHTQAVMNRCDSDPEYTKLQMQCRDNSNNNMGAVNQAPCLEAAGYLLNCYIHADPTNPNVGQWKQALAQNQQMLDSLNTEKSVPSIQH